ncbi:MAG: GTPase HflX [Candidatus Eremiobacteraeota bacterium]|nr:GTPase HflX [Candidatus Eremiobacteraeota bacterium]
MADRSSTHGPLARKRPNAVVLAVELYERRRWFAEELAEFEALIDATGASVIAEIVQSRARLDPAFLVGSGKARELADQIASLEADLLFVLNPLRPRQRRALEKLIAVPIVDRTMLILDVFARHARSREGKLQVELAQLRYRQSNLIGIGADLSRLGGGIGTRGPGETKLETDRRRIGERIKALSRSLESVRRSRATRRDRNGAEPIVALVGYTNAGKSSLLNRLARSDAFVADQPFATLDPLMRRAYIGSGHFVRLVDTVGFITDLPPDLVTAFRATLEELDAATLLLHVADASNPNWPRQASSVDAILHDLKLSSKPRLVVLNKCDIVSEPAHAAGHLCVSAKTGAGIDVLRAELRERFP